MKKSKIWIRTCVHLLLCITVAAYFSDIGNPITDDIKKISLLKQNIPKDYNITVYYLPKEVSGMCWVKLNVWRMEDSLTILSQKFGNISSNKDNIGTFIQMLREMRYLIGDGLEDAMQEFECHYRKEGWLTGRYFEFLEEFFNAANSSRRDIDCEPPPCPTRSSITTTIETQTTLPRHHSEGSSIEEKKFLLLEWSLLSLLFIPIIALVFLLIWKVKSRRNDPQVQGSLDGPFIAAEASAPPLDELSEKNRLNIIGEV